jgi:hypothetical protein
MRMILEKVRVLLVCAVACALVLAVQAIGWATTACKMPNPNTKFCIALPPGTTGSCGSYSGAGNQLQCEAHFLMKRNLWPDGSVMTKSGTVQQVQAQCYQQTTCLWTAATNTCSANSKPGVPRPGGKIIPGTATCPTDEG